MKKISWMVIAVLVITASTQAEDFYVDASRPDDSGDGTSWATAKHTIQAGIDATDGNDTVWVTNGIYDAGGTTAGTEAITNRVTFYGKSFITLRAVSTNPADTVIVGAPDPDTSGPGPKAIRCIRQGSGHSGMQVFGFTITNGYSAITGGSDQDVGAGICGWDTWSFMASNCVVVDCHGYERGGGVYGAVLHNSIVKGCSSKNAEGGGCTHVDAYNTLFAENYTAANKQGGAAYNQVNFWNCTFSNNMSGVDGTTGAGGAVGRCGTAYDCLFIDNKAKDGGALDHSGTFIRCTFKSNSAARNGGAITTYDGGSYTFRNCLFVGNIAGTSGSYKGNGSVLKFREDNADTVLFENCTMVGNQADGVASALYGSRTPTNIIAKNCIIYGNIDFDNGVTNNYNDKVLMTYCQTTPLPATGNNNITDAPIFVDDDNYSLDWGSPGIDQGITLSTITNDMLLVVRPIDGDASGTAEYDIGCYETPEPPAAQGSTIIIR